ncbi:hypothetical protein C0991_003385, partial [Blastosporella zonata]
MARPTPALVAAREAAVTELAARNAGEDWALEGTPPEALVARRLRNAYAFLASTEVDRTLDS